MQPCLLLLPAVPTGSGDLASALGFLWKSCSDKDQAGQAWL